MDVVQYLRVVRKRWLLVLLGLLVGLGSAAGLTAVSTPQYRAQTQLFVSAQNGADANALLQGSNFTQQRVKSYADVVTSPLVLRPVIERLGLAVGPQQLAEQVQASVPLDTVLIDVSVQDRSPAVAAMVADDIAREFIQAVVRLEQPSADQPSPVRVSIVRPAEVPTAPVSPRVSVNLALGLMVGTAAGVGLALLREVVDTTVRSTADVAALGAPALGTTLRASRRRRRPALVDPTTNTRQSEALRQIRTNLQFIDVDRPPQVVVLSSSVPGEGKTTTSVNLARTMSVAGVKTVLVDADLRRPRVADYLGLEGAVGLTTVLAAQAALDDVLQPYGDDGLMVLPSGMIPPNPSELLGSGQMAEVIQRLRDRADLIIIDSPPLLPVTDAAVLGRQADGVIVVARHGSARREQVAKAIGRLAAVDARVLGGILSMTPAKGSDSDTYGYSYQQDTKRGARRARRQERRRAAMAH